MSNNNETPPNKQFGYIGLSDLTHNQGRDWDLHKANSLRIGEILKTSSNPRLQKRGALMAGGQILQSKTDPETNTYRPMRMWDMSNGCSKFIDGVFTKDKEGKRKFRVTEAFRCQDRLCPTCQALKSMRMVRHAKKRLQWIQEEQAKLPEEDRAVFLFWTITMKTCSVTELRARILAMNEAFNRLRLYSFFRHFVLGFVKSLEVTRTKDGKAHPHFHVLLMVKPSYFIGGCIPTYTKAEFNAMWQKAMRLDYTPNTKINSVRPNSKNPKESLMGAVLETFKYTTKMDELVITDPDWLLTYAEQMIKIRAFSSGGTLKELVKESFTPEEIQRMEEEQAEENEEKINESVGVVRFDFWKTFQRYMTKRTEAIDEMLDPRIKIRKKVRALLRLYMEDRVKALEALTKIPRIVIKEKAQVAFWRWVHSNKWFPKLSWIWTITENKTRL